MPEKIAAFQGAHRFLSNFWPAEVVLDGVLYPTVEHAYVAAKTTDIVDRARIAEAATPGIAKRLGRELTLRPDWDAVKLDVMRVLLEQKFRPGTILHRDLKATAPAVLEEGNTWGDRFWGVCNGVGENHLGRLLMEIRDI